MFRFSTKYFILTVLLFLVEVLIALYVRDRIIRPYIGDTLVVILMYCAVKSFFSVSVMKTAIMVLLFSYLIEFFQYLHFVEFLGLQDNTLAKTVLGVGFSWIDIVAYTVGFAIILLFERRKLLFRSNDPAEMRNS
jgi:hypothetical protein